ncbi:hypothetical protein DCS_04021 [Drechmeria coniospora]|uniref:Uncharacterized protein n=1 Tax=Drechmeria coniospora TaxID=98403 RepID=A0A151GIU7_DRECN|nr:hypothetical protein DCS_04021 [Drechmeria coniospora]KYK57014.1 hypothetical protein DCS_04021 [Drechmeria coniospora]
MYADLPHYGLLASDSLQHRGSLVDLFHESIQIYPEAEGGRASSAALVERPAQDRGVQQVNFASAEPNEVDAITIVKRALRHIQVLGISTLPAMYPPSPATLILLKI